MVHTTRLATVGLTPSPTVRLTTCIVPYSCAHPKPGLAWRVGDDWWRVPISRTYYTVITPTTKLEIFRDDRAGDWYL